MLITSFTSVPQFVVCPVSGSALALSTWLAAGTGTVRRAIDHVDDALHDAVTIHIALEADLVRVYFHQADGQTVVIDERSCQHQAPHSCVSIIREFG